MYFVYEVRKVLYTITLVPNFHPSCILSLQRKIEEQIYLSKENVYADKFFQTVILAVIRVT